MLCLSLVKRYLITTLVRYNPPSLIIRPYTLLPGFLKPLWSAAYSKMASSVVESHSRPQSPSFLGHVVFRYELSRVALWTRMGGKLS